MWEHTEYERGCKAGSDGEPFDSTRSIYWRRGWSTGNAERDQPNSMPEVIN